MSSETIFPAFYHDLPGGKEKNAAKKLFFMDPFMYHVPMDHVPCIKFAR